MLPGFSLHFTQIFVFSSNFCRPEGVGELEAQRHWGERDLHLSWAHLYQCLGFRRTTWRADSIRMKDKTQESTSHVVWSSRLLYSYLGPIESRLVKGPRSRTLITWCLLSFTLVIVIILTFLRILLSPLIFLILYYYFWYFWWRSVLHSFTAPWCTQKFWKL